VIGSIDYVGLGAVISATAAAIVSVIVALQQRPLGTKVDDVHAAVTTSNGTTLGMIADKVSAQLDAQDAADPPK
jgi:hypothetical protein